MSKIEKLMTVKEKIINKIVSIKNIEKTKSNFIFKGSILKEFFKYHSIKLTTILTGFSLFLSLICIIFPVELELAISSLSLILILLVPSIFIDVSDYFPFKKKIIKHNEYLFEKLNAEKINEIKKNLTNDFNKKEIEMLLEGNLNKEDLKEVFFVINEIIGEKEVFKIFKQLDFKGNISDPYVLISIIEETIKNIKNKEQEEKKDVKNELLKANKKIFNSLINKQNEKKVEYEEVKL